MDADYQFDHKDMTVWMPGEQERSDTIAMFVDIFKNDSLYRALFQEGDKFYSGLSEFFGIMFDIGLKYHQVFVAGDYMGGAIFFPPGINHVSFIEQLLLLKTAVRVFSFKKVIPSVLALNDLDRAKPKGLQYYLFAVGHRPGPVLSHHGIATALTLPTLQECDRIEVPCYAEFTSPQSAAWGEKKGFKVIAEKKILFHPDVVVRLAVREPQHHPKPPDVTHFHPL